MRKNIFSVVFAFMMLLSMSAIAFATDFDTPVTPDEPEPYQYAQSAYATCSISNGTATAGVYVTGKTDVTKIEATYSLQKKNGNSWGTVSGASWSKAVNGKSLSASSTKSVSKGTYRTKAVIKVYSGSNYETITKYSAAVTN